MKIYLDLLPEERKKELKRKKLFWTILRQEVLFSFPFLVLVVIFLNIYFIIGIQRENLLVMGTQQQLQGKYQELNAYEDAFKKRNELSASIGKFQNSHLVWSNIIVKISEITPDGIFLTNFSTKEYKVLLVGKAKSRDILINFKNELAASGCAENVNVPLSDLVNRTNVSFQMDFTVDTRCIKETKK